MRYIYPKIVGITLLTALLAGTFVFPKETKAAGIDKCLSGALSGVMGDILKGFIPSVPGVSQKVPVDDKGAQSATRGFQFDECMLAVKDEAIKIALQNLKKRLLDQMVDQTISWIRDDSEPKYVTNFKDFTESAIEDAAGNSLREIGLADLYPDENLSAGLKQAILSRSQKVRFSDLISSSFTDEEQGGGIEEFKNDFRKGGFDMLQRASMPNNNPEDVALTTKYYAEMEEIEVVAERNAIVGAGGAISVIDCSRWVLVKMDPNAPNGAGDFYLPYGQKTPRVISTPKPQKEAPPSNIPNTKFICQNDPTGAGQYITTPNTAVNAVSNKVATFDIDYILTMNDISEYIGGIADAMFNRILKEGFDAFQRGTGRGEGNNQEYLEDPKIQEGINEYNTVEEKIKGEANEEIKRDLVAKSQALINAASSSLAASNATLQVVTNLNPVLNATSSPEGLAVCMEYRLAFFPAFTSPDPQPSWWPTGNRPTVIQKLKALVNLLRNTTNPYKNSFTDAFEDAESFLARANAINGNTSPNVIKKLQDDIKALEETLPPKRTESTTHDANTLNFFNQANRERNNCNGGITYQ